MKALSYDNKFAQQHDDGKIELRIRRWSQLEPPTWWWSQIDFPSDIKH